MSGRTVLIHLNITVDAFDDDEAIELAEAYCRRHDIPVDDVADMDPI